VQLEVDLSSFAGGHDAYVTRPNAFAARLARILEQQARAVNNDCSELAWRAPGAGCRSSFSSGNHARIFAAIAGGQHSTLCALVLAWAEVGKAASARA